MPDQSEVLQDAVGLTGLGGAELNAEGRFLEADAGFLSMLGKRKEDLLGQPWQVTVHPDDHGRAQNAYRLARTNGHAYVEVRAVRNDATIVCQALTVTRLCGIGGVFTGYRCLRHDISGYKRDRDVLRLAVESAPHGLVLFDSHGNIRSVNRAVERLFGYTREELIGRTVEILLPERFRVHHAVHRRAFNDKHSAGAPGRDLSGVRKDGVEIPLQVYLNRMEADAGELILCTIVDIAERVRYEELLQLAKQTADAANRAKGDFLARMSHEIRTPMNLIMGMNALLLDSPLDEKQRQHVEISYRNVRRLLRLINGILDLSKVEAGKLTLEAVPFDLHEVVEECAATIAAAIEQKGLHLECSIDADVWPYWTGDAERLQQILLNVVGNSIKFTAQGKIGVRIRSECSGDVNHPSLDKGLRFEVTDTGCGVPPDKTSIIFEAFQQAEGSMDRPFEGTGLGLSIAKTLVEMMSGRIWVEERAEPGSKFVFTVFFPRASEGDVCAKKAVVASATGAEKVKPGTRVLLVEDNAENVILMRAYLENLPLSLDYASNGAEALKACRRESYDLVFMDIQMPVMDGHAATREIRAWEKARSAPRVPIVALTADALSGAASESLEAGCDAHLTKPVDRNDLVEAIVKFATHPVRPAGSIAASLAALRPAYLKHRSADLITMRNALAAGDFATVQRIGHNCRGTGVGYGFPAISCLGSAIETAAKGRDEEGLHESFHRFDACVRAASVS